jgi:putative ABC transport system ATP-binding protein
MSCWRQWGSRSVPATHPVLVLADEPTANLDTENGRQVMEIMQRLNQETGTTFVFATHDPRVIPFARRVVELRDGRVRENTEPMLKR